MQAGPLRAFLALLGVVGLAILASTGAGPDRPGADSAAASVPRAAGSRGEVPKPRIEFDPIPYDRERRRQMANYSYRHYGAREWRLDPRAIVLHYTAGPTYESAFSTFASNAPSLGEKPGVCAQFVVDKDARSIPTRLRSLPPCDRAQPTWAVGMRWSRRTSRRACEREAILGLRAQGLGYAPRRLAQAALPGSRCEIDRSAWPTTRTCSRSGGLRNDHVDWPQDEVAASASGDPKDRSAGRVVAPARSRAPQRIPFARA